MIFDEKYTPILAPQGFQQFNLPGTDLVISSLPQGLPKGATAAIVQIQNTSREGAFCFATTGGQGNTELLVIAAGEKLYLTNAEQIKTLVMDGGQDYSIQFFTGGQGSTS